MKCQVGLFHFPTVKYPLFLFCVLSLLVTGCSSQPTLQAMRTEQETESSAPTPTPNLVPELLTVLPSPTTSEMMTSNQLSPTGTLPPLTYQDLEVHRLPPSVQNKSRVFGPGFWNSEYKFTFAYNIKDASRIWGSYNIATNTESLAFAPESYNDNFWPSRSLWQVSDQQEVVGYFSTSGAYVLYSLLDGSTDNPPSRTEVWLANTLNGQLIKLQTFESLNLVVSHAAWSKDESKLYFSVTYEGPDEIFVTEVSNGETMPLSAITDFNGVSEETWSLSPDEQALAVIDHNQHLVIVPLNGGRSQVVDSGNSLLPSWSADGQELYYWWGNSPDEPRHMSELRKYDRLTGKISTMVSESSLLKGLETLNEADQANNILQAGSPYVVSPEEKKLLIWGDSLYWIILNP